MVADLEQPIKKGIAAPPKLKDQVRSWATVIGIRAAARKFGVKEGTAMYWAWKEHWELPAVFRQMTRALKQASSDAHEAQQSVITEQGEESRLYLSSAGLKASYHAARSSGRHLMTKEASQSMLNTARSLDTVHGWTAQRTAGPTVQVANVVLPSPEQQAERQAMFAKLEEITRRLAAPEHGTT